MWVRISDDIDPSPVHGQAVQYRNTDTGLQAAVYYTGAGTGLPVGYYVFLASERLFPVFATKEEAVYRADSLLQPFYVALS